MPRRTKYQVAASGENIAKVVLIERQQVIKVLTQEVEKLKLLHKDTVDPLRTIGAVTREGGKRESAKNNCTRRSQQCYHA